jgi:DNA adenine methylase
MAVAKPFLRWAGSKRKQISRLSQFCPDKYKRYIEPFAGSACLFFHLQPQVALISDKNAELIETYAVVREHPVDVYAGVMAIPRSSRTYYAVRKQDPRHLSEIERAIRFIYLNRNCFNGIFRTNSAGRFNVPFASSRAGVFVSCEEFLLAAALLRRARLRAWDFGTALRHVRRDDFVYLDPPYAVDARRVFREYGARPFGAKDLGRLKEHLQRIDARGAAFLVSYADSKEARDLAKPWRVSRMRVRRYVAGFAGARKRTYELLITNVKPGNSG